MYFIQCVVKSDIVKIIKKILKINSLYDGIDMKYIMNAINKLFGKELPKPMGRWNIENCSKKINNKIDLSNEDHCGPCGQYAISKIKTTNSFVVELEKNAVLKK